MKRYEKTVTVDIKISVLKIIFENLKIRYTSEIKLYNWPKVI